MTLKEKISDKFTRFSYGVSDQFVTFALESPVLFTVILIGLVAVLIFAGVVWLTGIWKYAVYALALYLVFRVLSSGAVQAAISAAREHPRQSAMFAFGIVVLGLALPFVATGQLYANVSGVATYKVVGGKGLFGIFIANMDPSTFNVQVQAASAFYGAPYLHAPKPAPKASSEPGDGWYMCMQAVSMDQTASGPQYCWKIPGIDVLSKAAEGVDKSFSFSVRNYPFPSEKGYLVFTVYKDGSPLVQRRVIYSVMSGSGATVYAPVIAPETNSSSQ